MKRTTNNTIATLNRNDLDAIFTSKVTSLLAQGYILNPGTMSGSESEIAKVDLRRGDELLRVWMEEDRDCMTDIRTLHIRVGRCNDERCYTRGGYDRFGATVWNSKLEVLEDTELAVIDPRKGVYASVEDGRAIEQLRNARWKTLGDRRWGGSRKELTSPAAKAIALRFIQRQPKMKSCKLADITKVERIERLDWKATQPTFEGYCITARGKSFTLKPAKA